MKREPGMAARRGPTLPVVAGGVVAKSPSPQDDRMYAATTICPSPLEGEVGRA
jgi:hypothetical protein